ncbi:hypothetical protein [Anaerospora hongkongensis]|uniref:hypothetical protein n=1 Tax=Anaerospora hongkongensis TaxID=244830 RepID=UPI0028A1435F|nr:hypothetical protein [Anaerospora hongkongensis]
MLCEEQKKSIESVIDFHLGKSKTMTKDEILKTVEHAIRILCFDVILDLEKAAQDQGARSITLYRAKKKKKAPVMVENLELLL